MSDATEFDIGSEVICTDGACGVLKRVVVDPVARAITHLVVEPKHGHAAGHLVPIRHVASGGKKIQLSCTQSQFAALDAAEESDFLPAENVMGYGGGELFMMPFYSLRGGGSGTGSGSFIGGTMHSDLENQERVPVGEVELRRGDPVRATDGDIGKVEGLVVDPSDYHVTHFLLQEGHRWAKKRVAIPIGAVDHVGDIIRLNLTMEEVENLPPIDVDHPLA